MWAGSVRGGLINIREVGMKIYSDALPGTEYGLSEKAVLSIYQGEEKDIWIGTDSGLFKYIAAQDKIEPVELNINK